MVTGVKYQALKMQNIFLRVTSEQCQIQIDIQAVLEVVCFFFFSSFFYFVIIRIFYYFQQ